MSLRLVAVDGELVDRPARTVPDFSALSRRARDVLYMLTIGEVDVSDDGLFTLRVQHLTQTMSCSEGAAARALQELRDRGFITLVKETRGRRPRVWRINDRWNPSLSLGQRASH